MGYTEDHVIENFESLTEDRQTKLVIEILKSLTSSQLQEVRDFLSEF